VGNFDQNQPAYVKETIQSWEAQGLCRLFRKVWQFINAMLTTRQTVERAA